MNEIERRYLETITHIRCGDVIRQGMLNLFLKGDYPSLQKLIDEIKEKIK